MHPTSHLPWSLYSVPMEQIPFNKLPTNLPKNIKSIRDLESFMITYNPSIQLPFHGLSQYMSWLNDDQEKTFFEQTLPSIWRLCKYGTIYFKNEVARLEIGRNSSVTLSRAQVAILLANCFFSTFPRRNVTSAMMPSFTMNS